MRRQGEPAQLACRPLSWMMRATISAPVTPSESQTMSATSSVGLSLA